MNLKAIRQSKGISLAKLSDATGIHRRTLEDIEKRGDCLVSNAVLLAEALDVSLDALCLTDPINEATRPRL